MHGPGTAALILQPPEEIGVGPDQVDLDPLGERCEEVAEGDLGSAEFGRIGVDRQVESGLGAHRRAPGSGIGE